MSDDAKMPETPEGEWHGHEGMSADLSKPHGFQDIIADKCPDGLKYLPAIPDIDYVGAYVYLAAVYPLVGMETSLWEYYHSQSDIDIKVGTYITEEPPLKLYGTKFHNTKEAHRLHWHGDRDAVLRFLEFTQTLILRDAKRNRTWALALHEIEMPYPKSGNDEKITCVVLLPYSDTMAFVPGRNSGVPIMHCIEKDYCQEYLNWIALQEQLGFNMQACEAQGDVYIGQRPQPAEAYPFFKAPEIRAAAQIVGM